MDQKFVSKILKTACFYTIYVLIVVSIIFYVKKYIYKNNITYPIGDYVENIFKSYFFGDSKYISDMFEFKQSKRITQPKVNEEELKDLDVCEKLEIGGLTNEVKEIIEKAFLTRSKKYKQMCNDISFNHVKGIILYGPPGTGKTLIARKLSENVLKCNSFKIVSGPELLDKWIGASEKNIRDLFLEAEKGTDDELHVIVFDEIDALCKKRSFMNDAGSNCQSNIVNTLLSKMDGYDRLNNILIIGTTNRLDVIDPAFLRPGRFEIKLNIKLPDFEGRKEIFKIHLNKVIKRGYYTLDCEYSDLADLTNGYSGADIEGMIRSVISKKMIANSETETVLCLEDFKKIDF